MARPLVADSNDTGESSPLRGGGGLPFTSSRDEMNLAEFPLTVLSTRVNTEVKTLEFTDTHRTKEGELVERNWIITGADKFGLPTSTDDDVVLGLICLSMDKGFRDRKIFFTRYELLKILRWTSEGRSYQRLTKSLDRLSGVRIRASNAFYDNVAKAYQTVNFGIIDAYEINDERNSKGKLGADTTSYFIWSEQIFESFKAGFIKKLDLDVYFSLRSAVSRRLYRYLDKHFYYRSVVERPLMQFAFEKIGLARTYKFVSSVKQQIEPAAEELVRMGFLADFEFAGRGEATVVRFTAANGGQTSSPRRVAPAEPVLPPELPEEGRALVQELLKRGIAMGQAGKLIRALAPDAYSRVSEILRYYDNLVETADRRVSKNPVGFLYRAVENPFKFTVPGTAYGIAPGVTRRSSQPDLKVLRSRQQELAPAPEQDADVELHKQYVQGEVRRFRATLGESELKLVYDKVLEKVGCLRSVLEPVRFKEAVEGCVFDELKRRSDPLSYSEWRKRVKKR